MISSTSLFTAPSLVPFEGTAPAPMKYRLFNWLGVPGAPAFFRLLSTRPTVASGTAATTATSLPAIPGARSLCRRATFSLHSFFPPFDFIPPSGIAKGGPKRETYEPLPGLRIPNWWMLRGATPQVWVAMNVFAHLRICLHNLFQLMTSQVSTCSSTHCCDLSNNRSHQRSEHSTMGMPPWPLQAQPWPPWRWTKPSPGTQPFAGSCHQPLSGFPLPCKQKKGHSLYVT